MDDHSYLIKASEEEILNTWYSLGSVTVNKQTKMYTQGSLVRVDCSDGNGLSSAPLHNRILFCAVTYRVDNKRWFPIDWEEMTIDDVQGTAVAYQGITTPYWVILPAKYSATFMPDKDFLPYNNEEITVDNGCINISEEELEQILTSIGFPFVNFGDVELSKNEITKYCIKPAMQRYFTFRPIIKEEPGNQISRGAEFLVPFPIDAYACVPFYTVPGGSGQSAASGNPFTYYNEMQMVGGMGSAGGRFGRGVHYNGKQVPGYVGLEWRNMMIDQLAANQGFLNFFRREKYSRKKIDGMWYAYGFSTIGGNLNFKWLCGSQDWDDIPYEDLEVLARPMAKIAVLKNIGLIRSLVKTDIAGQLDATVLTNEAKALEDQIKPIISSIGLTGQLALSRGGG
jgi:hypothetical protein